MKQEFALFSHNLRLGKCLTLRKSKGHFVCSWRCDRCRCRRRRCWRFRCCRQSIKRTSSSTSLLWFLFFAMLLFLLPRLLFILAHFYALCTAHCAAICCLPLFLCRLSSTIVFVFVFIILFFRYCGLPSAVCWPLNLIPTYLANKINLPQLVWAQCQGSVRFNVCRRLTGPRVCVSATPWDSLCFLWVADISLSFSYSCFLSLSFCCFWLRLINKAVNKA